MINFARDKLYRKALEFAKWAVFGVNVALSIAGIRANAAVEMQARADQFLEVPAITAGWVGWLLTGFTAFFISALLWYGFKTFISNPYGIPLVIERIFRTQAQGMVKILIMIMSLAVYGIFGYAMYHGYKFDLATTQYGFALSTLNPSVNPIAIAPWFLVFGPELCDAVLEVSEQNQQPFGGGSSGGGASAGYLD